MLIKILCGAAVPCLLLGLCACKKEVRQHKERAVRVMVQQPQKRIFREQIPVQGTVKPVEYATISAKISGTLELLNVSEGDKRKTGDVLFGIDRQILKNQVVVKEDEINVKEAALKSAELTGIWERKLRLIEQKQYDAHQFLAELKQMVTDVVMEVMRDNSNRHVSIAEEVTKKSKKK